MKLERQEHAARNFSNVSVALLMLLAAPLAAQDKGEALTPTDQSVPAIDEALRRFEESVREMRADFWKNPARPPDPEWVREKLAHMVEVDQYMRRYTSKPHDWGYSDEDREVFTGRFMVLWKEIDAGNTEDLKMLLAIHGWFTISEFGEKADHEAWLLVQHADHDVDFQREVLGILEKLLETKETSRQNYAYLYDRVASAEDRPQRYGTQGRCVGPAKWEPNELEHPERIDELRASVGLGTLDDYKAVFVGLCP